MPPQPSPPPATPAGPASRPPAGALASLSFGGVADAYERARPGYPPEAARWLVGDRPVRVLELGAGTGKLTAELVALGHQVVATDPLAQMLGHLAARLPPAQVVQARAEQIPLPSRSVQTVVSAQAFHWFDLELALPEIARVLGPGGTIALVWNERDARVPWVRRLGDLIGTQDQDTDPTNRLLGSQLFGYVDKTTFRFWQRLDRPRLRDLVGSRSNVATMTASDRDRVLRAVDALYDDYGRGRDGLLLPYVTRCFKATVRPRADPEPPGPSSPPHDGDDHALLIDFS